MKMMFVVFAVLGFSVVSCEKKDHSEKYSYDLTENGCPTGKHKFSSRSAMCEGLRDHSKNRGCAFSLRKKMHDDHGCGAWPSPSVNFSCENASGYMITDSSPVVDITASLCR